MNGTTGLSPHIKFGTISIREVHTTLTNALGEHHPIIRQLFWREFFYYIVHHFPHVMKTTFIKKYEQLQFRNDKKLFQHWINGTTGFPIIDAAMRELKQTGNMRNRLRMISASFLAKDLLVDWKWGERYFAKYLKDYDPVVNRNSWQWVASVGVDAVPYFRIFNPWIQQKKFDPNAEYIRHWIPELENSPATAIHSIYKKPVENYPSPIVNHKEQVHQCKLLYTNIAQIQ